MLETYQRGNQKLTIEECNKTQLPKENWQWSTKHYTER